MKTLTDIADQFKPEGKVIAIREYGNGNINRTFLVTLEDSSEKHFILQRINAQVFRQPERVMQNMEIATQHISDRVQRISFSLERRWEVPRVLLTRDLQNHVVDAEGSFWRAISFIEGAEFFDTIQDGDRAREVGCALGMFHHLVSDLPPEKLADTLPGFHITPGYLQHYQEVLPKTQVASSAEVKYCLQFVRDRADRASVLERARSCGLLKLRPIHGDPKVNNIAFDRATGRAIAAIDLDTVKPGLVHYDIGDCLRSSCNPLGEETEQWQKVQFDLDICQSVLQGYFSVAKDFLTEQDCTYLYDAIGLIAFELGLRFFTDYLAGNVYFKTTYPEHNLARALVQFKLAESIESQETVLRKIIEEMRV